MFAVIGDSILICSLLFSSLTSAHRRYSVFALCHLHKLCSLTRFIKKIFQVSFCAGDMTEISGLPFFKIITILPLVYANTRLVIQVKCPGNPVLHEMVTRSRPGEDFKVECVNSPWNGESSYSFLSLFLFLSLSLSLSRKVTET